MPLLIGTVIGAMANPTTGYFTGNWDVNIAAEFEHGPVRGDINDYGIVDVTDMNMIISIFLNN